jgi:hypothetical protein
MSDKEFKEYMQTVEKRGYLDIKPYFPYSRVLQGLTLRNESDQNHELEGWVNNFILK